MIASLFPLLLTLAPLQGERVYLDTPAVIADSCMTIPTDTSGLKTVCAEARVALKSVSERRGMAESWWTLLFVAPGDTVSASIRHGNSDYGDILDRRFTRMEILRGSEVLFSGEVDGFASSPGAFNTLSAELDTSGTLLLRGGGKSKEVVAEVELGAPFFPEETSVAVCGGEGRVSLFCCETSRNPQTVMATQWTIESLREHMRSSEDVAEGFWKYLDRENNPEYARIGGRYILATVKNPDGGYDIVYVDGAQTYSEQWKPMMLKGRLIPTIFAHHYDLNWLDSSFEYMSEDIHADIADGAILSLSFPLLKTVVRYSKMPLE